MLTPLPSSFLDDYAYRPKIPTQHPLQYFYNVSCPLRKLASSVISEMNLALGSKNSTGISQLAPLGLGMAITLVDENDE